MIYSIEDYEEQNEVKLINDYIGSAERKRLIELKEYAEGNNPLIAARKKMICAELEDSSNNKYETLVENVFVPNYKSKYGFYDQVISQKVNALTTEMPIIDGVDEKVRKQLGFANKKAAYLAAEMGYSFTFVGAGNQFVVFDTENIIPFADERGNLKILLRFWQSTIKNQTVLYYERYNEKGIQTFKVVANRAEAITQLVPYKVTVYQSEITTQFQENEIRALPIVIFKNNEKLKPDLTPSIKSKIDILDIIESDLYNNIEEFSDVWMSVSADVDVETAKQIKKSIRKTKTIVAKDADIKFGTLQIPYEARQTAINNLKQELVEDGGIIDFKEIKGNATATEINARLYKLTQKVSDFEWYDDEYLTNVVRIWQLYNNRSFEINITFQKLFIKNNLETVNIANSVYDKISQKSYLKLLEQANVIEDAEDEIMQIEKEAITKFDLGDEYGQGTQTNGQETVGIEQAKPETIPE